MKGSKIYTFLIAGLPMLVLVVLSGFLLYRHFSSLAGVNLSFSLVNYLQSHASVAGVRAMTSVEYPAMVSGIETKENLVTIRLADENNRNISSIVFNKNEYAVPEESGGVITTSQKSGVTIYRLVDGKVSFLQIDELKVGNKVSVNLRQQLLGKVNSFYQINVLE